MSLQPRRHFIRRFSYHSSKTSNPFVRGSIRHFYHNDTCPAVADLIQRRLDGRRLPARYRCRFLDIAVRRLIRQIFLQLRHFYHKKKLRSTAQITRRDIRSRTGDLERYWTQGTTQSIHKHTLYTLSLASPTCLAAVLSAVGTNRLVVPHVKLSTVGSRAFPVVGPQIWNDLPEDVASAESLSTFRQRLKTHLFTKSFPDCFLNIH